MLAPRGMICLKKENIKQRLGPIVMLAKRAGGTARGPPRVTVIHGPLNHVSLWFLRKANAGAGSGSSRAAPFSLLRRVGKAETECCFPYPCPGGPQMLRPHVGKTAHQELWNPCKCQHSDIPSWVKAHLPLGV